jgi:TRAP-type C4-dicarboxylate transport system substrate-binding protein
MKGRLEKSQMLRRLASTAALVVALAFTSQLQAMDLRVLSSWDNSHPARRILLQTYLKNVEAASKGDFKFNISGPETVSPFEQLQPVGSGVFQLLFTHSAYHIGTTPYLIPIDALHGDSKRVRESGIYDLIDKHYERFGLKLVFLVKPQEDTGYQIILRAPVGSSGDLQGRKIRGTQSYTGVLALLHAAPVVLPPSEVYSALEKGIVDGTAWPAIGIVDYKWNEVAKYIMRPKFGSASYFLLANLASWNKLTEAQRAVMVEEGKNIQSFWDPEWLRLVKVEEDALLTQGGSFTDVGPELRPKVSAVFEQGLWDLAAKPDPTAIAELHDFSKKHGLSN